MAGIADRQLQRITENAHRLAEFDAVPGRVFSGLRGIPFELHDVSLALSLLGEVRPNGLALSCGAAQCCDESAFFSSGADRCSAC